jgi:putative flippase GtrA
MGSRWQRFLAEVGRFLAVGGVATIVALFLFNLLVHGFNTAHKALLDDHVIVAYILANTVGMAISYRGSRSWAFRDRPPRQADGGRLAFLVINVATMTLPIGCLFVSRNLLGLSDPISDNISANVIGLAMGLVARFYLFRAFVFRRPVHLPHLALPHHPASNPHQPVSRPTEQSTSDPVPPPAP